MSELLPFGLPLPDTSEYLVETWKFSLSLSVKLGDLSNA